MFFQETPPDTSAYMIAGYAIFFLISVIYVLSVFLRQRNLERDLETLETIQTEARQTPARAPGAGSTGGRGSRKKVTRRK